MKYIAEDDPRFKSIEQKIIQLAKGNLNTYLRNGKDNDVLESIITTLNMLTENWKDRVQYIPFHSYDHYKKSVQVFTCVVNEAYHIQTMSDFGLELLQLPKNEIIGKKITELIDPEQKLYLQKLLDLLPVTPTHNKVIQLQFIQHALLHIFETHIQYSSHTRTYFFQFISIQAYKNKSVITRSANKRKQRVYIEQQVQKVYDHLSKLDKFTATTFGDLCKEFGLNSFTLKTEFKRMYNLSMYKYYMMKRAERAKILIEHTNVSLKNIAEQTGFSSYKTFHSNFKSIYNVSPKKIRNSES